MANQEHLHFFYNGGPDEWNTYVNQQNSSFEADLFWTSFHNSEMERTDFRYAYFEQTVFANCDLSQALNLSDSRHMGPSTLGTDTISKSKGDIPEQFLRGCGLQDWEIQQTQIYQEGLTNNQIIDINQMVFELRGANPIQFYSCFISYSHEERVFARQLQDAFQKRGVRYWLDERQILPGDEIYEAVNRGINNWDKVLLCCSQSSLKSWWVDNEITTAFSKEQKFMKQRGEKVLALIPLDLDGFLFSNECKNTKAHQIKERLAADFTGCGEESSKFDTQLEKVMQALMTNKKGRERSPEPLL